MIKLQKEDVNGRSLQPCGELTPLQPHAMHNLLEVKRGLSEFVFGYKQHTCEDHAREYSRQYELTIG